MNQFKTLAEARSAYDVLAAQLADTQQKMVEMTELETQLAEWKALSTVRATENEKFRLSISQKDQEIAGLKGEKESLSEQISTLQTQVEALEKNKKTARIEARELVAASGGAPIAVDQAEIQKMQVGSEREFLQAMAKETNPAELSRLYREYNKLFRANGKTK